MVYLHLLTRAWIPTRTGTPNPMATLYCTETVSIGTNLDSDSDPDVPGYVSQSMPGNVNKPLDVNVNVLSF